MGMWETIEHAHECRGWGGSGRLGGGSAERTKVCDCGRMRNAIERLPEGHPAAAELEAKVTACCPARKAKATPEELAKASREAVYAAQRLRGSMKDPNRAR